MFLLFLGASEIVKEVLIDTLQTACQNLMKRFIISQDIFFDTFIFEDDKDTLDVVVQTLESMKLSYEIISEIDANFISKLKTGSYDFGTFFLEFISLFKVLLASSCLLQSLHHTYHCYQKLRALAQY